MSKLRSLSYKIVRIIARKDYILDVTGIRLTPGNNGEHCRGNGKHKNIFGKYIECSCDECDYMLTCFDEDINP